MSAFDEEGAVVWEVKLKQKGAYTVQANKEFGSFAPIGPMKGEIPSAEANAYVSRLLTQCEILNNDTYIKEDQIIDLNFTRQTMLDRMQQGKVNGLDEKEK